MEDVLARVLGVLDSYLSKLHNEGFIMSDKTVQMIPIHKEEGRLVLYFNVIRRGRTDDEIDLLVRQHKVELYLITGYPDISLKYNIVG